MAPTGARQTSSVTQPVEVPLPPLVGVAYEELALRFAERGYNAIAFDYFGRTAGVSKRSDDFEFMEHVQQTTADGIQADVGAAAEYLRSPAGGSCRSLFTIGFCFGGRNSWLAAASGHGVRGAIGFYGHPGVHPLMPGRGPTDRAAEMKAPVLALQAGDDQNITVALNAAYDEALSAAGVEHELVTYEGAPHSFFDRRHEDFAEASEDAWNRVLAFIDRHSS